MESEYSNESPSDDDESHHINPSEINRFQIFLLVLKEELVQKRGYDCKIFSNRFGSQELHVCNTEDQKTKALSYKIILPKRSVVIWFYRGKLKMGLYNSLDVQEAIMQAELNVNVLDWEQIIDGYLLSIPCGSVQNKEDLTKCEITLFNILYHPTRLGMYTKRYAITRCLRRIKKCISPDRMYC